MGSDVMINIIIGQLNQVRMNLYTVFYCSAWLFKSLFISFRGHFALCLVKTEIKTLFCKALFETLLQGLQMLCGYGSV